MAQYSIVDSSRHGSDVFVSGARLEIGRWCGSGHFIPSSGVTLPRNVAEALLGVKLVEHLEEDGAIFAAEAEIESFNPELWAKAQKQEAGSRAFLDLDLEPGEIWAIGRTCCETRQHGCAYLDSCSAEAPTGGVIIRWAAPSA